MKPLRRILVLVLCLLLPIAGLAASGLTGSCPMQGVVSDASHGGATGDMADMTDMADCVTAQPTHPTDHGHSPSCKVTSQCQLGSLYHPAFVPVAYRPAGLVSPLTYYYAEPLIVQRLDELWRPPRAS